MNLVNIPVELENGRVTPKGDVTLPEKAYAFLTIVSADTILPNTGLPISEMPPPPITEAQAEEFFNKWAGKFELRTIGSPRERASVADDEAAEALPDCAPMTADAEAFIQRWKSKFTLRAQGAEHDVKLAYLLQKYCR